MRPSKAFRACFPPAPFPPLSLYSTEILDQVQAKVLMEYFRTGSLMSAWRAACALSDALALAEDIGPDSLMPSGIDAMRAHILCDECGAIRLLSALTRQGLQYFCTDTCIVPNEPSPPPIPPPGGNPAPPPGGNPAPPPEGNPAPPPGWNPAPPPGGRDPILKFAFNTFHDEHRYLAIDKKERPRLIEGIRRLFLTRDYVQTDNEVEQREYRDMYIDTTRKTTKPRAAGQPRRTMSHREPFDLEVEAAFPFLRAPQYIGITNQTSIQPVGIHIDQNIGATAGKYSLRRV